MYAGDRALVHLSEERAAPGRGRGNLGHVAFSTDSLAPVVEQLERQGIPYRVTRVPGPAIDQVFFEDPVGNGIEVNAPRR